MLDLANDMRSLGEFKRKPSIYSTASERPGTRWS